MDLRLSVPLLAIILLARCENPARNATVGSSAIKADNATSRPASICAVCSCTDSYVDCSNRSLETHFEMEQWLMMNVTAKVISFEHNCMVHVTPFPQIVVERLILRKNRITRIDYRAFKELINLTELDLSYNQLTPQMLQPHVFEGRYSPEAYEPLSSLQILNLSCNVLHWLHQSIFEHIADLRVLNLAGNPFGVFDYRTSIAISSLSYLEELDISYCELKELPGLQFHNAKHLKRLNLAGNQFAIPPNALEEAKTLEYLNLDANPIHIIKHFPKLTKLKELRLSEMPNLTEIRYGGLSELTGLESLYVQDCKKFKRIDEYAMASKTAEGRMWPPLKKLIIKSNALQLLPMLLVGRWDKLEELRLTDNQWSCDCRNQYLIGTVLPEYGKALMGDEVNELTCAGPPEHEGKKLTSLADRNLRCLDLWSARPEKDAAILVGVLIGLLVAMPIGMVFFIFWRRGFFFCGSQGPATFSRAFYKRASNDDDI